MIYQSYGKKYRYLVKFELENYDFLCQIAHHHDVSIAVLLNHLVAYARKGNIRFSDEFLSHVTNGSCQTSP